MNKEFLTEHSYSHFSRSLDHRKRLTDSHLNYTNLHKLMKLQVNHCCEEISQFIMLTGARYEGREKIISPLGGHQFKEMGEEFKCESSQPLVHKKPWYRE